MKRFAFLLLTAVLAAASAHAAAPADPDKGAKVALVVGNSSYREGPLKNPVNDARAMAKLLQEKGFIVIERENVTKAQLEDAIGEFSEKLSEGSTGLFFYAGHGVQVSGHNYLMPVDVRIQSEQRVRLETVDVDIVVDQMQAAHTKVSMVILDACRNNPFERRFRAVGGGLAQISAPEGTFIAYATAPGNVAADGEGANGTYTQEILRAMRQPGLKVEDVFKSVRINVSRVTGGAQVPWEASSLTGDFYFTPPAPVAESTGDAELRAAFERQQQEIARLQRQASAGATAADAELRAALDQKQQEIVRLQQQASAGTTAARALTRADAQGTFVSTLLRSNTGRYPEVDAQIIVQGHKVSGFGMPKTGTGTAYAAPCRVAGSVEETTVHFTVSCVFGTSTGGVQALTYDSIYDGDLVQEPDGSLAFHTKYRVVAQTGERNTGTTVWKKYETDTAQGTYYGHIVGINKLGETDAVIVLSDGEVTGFTQGLTPCKIQGTVGGSFVNFTMRCSTLYLDVDFDGELVKADGVPQLKTRFSTNERVAGNVAWLPRR